MPRFQGLHVVPKVGPPNRDSRGLEPYLALERKPKCKRRADPERATDVILVALGAVTAIVIGILVTAVRAGLQ